VFGLLLAPIFAGAAMAMNSVSVVSNALAYGGPNYSSRRWPAALLKVQCRSGSELAVGGTLQDLMQRMLRLIAALVVLGAVWPAPHALATSGKHAVSAAGCDDALSVHEPPGTLCVAVCQPASVLGVHHAQAPAFSADEPHADQHQRLRLPSAVVVVRGIALTQSDPPAYLRFHRFLL
jgi:hypothetical protein